MMLFTGYDPREKDGWHAFAQSLLDTSPGVGLTPLTDDQADGSNKFTYARFRIPRLCNWEGWSLFVDGCDMLLREDIRKLWVLRNPKYAVQVVKHNYVTRHERKYIGTEMEIENASYPRKNWSSVILFNNSHPAHFKARKEMDRFDGAFLHRFGWLQDREIGELPVEWNWLADEYGENKDAKLLHWTAGMPGFKHYANAPMAEHWHAAAKTFHSER